MPTMRSFSSFASTPDLGGSFIGGANSMTALIQAGNQLKLGREKIAADMAQANMEAQAKQQALQSQALRDEQELRVKDQYQQSMLGMKQRELDQAQEMVNLKTQEAAQQFQAQQGFQQEMATLTSSGTDVNEAFKQAALKFGPQMGLPGSAYSGLMPDEGGGGGMADFGAASPVEGLPEDFRQVQTGPASRRIIQLPKSVEEDGGEATPVPGLPGKMEYRGKVYSTKDPTELTDLRKKRDRLEAAQEKDERGAAAVAASKDTKKLPKAQQMFKDTYETRASEIRAVEDQIKAFSKPGATAPSVKDYEGKPVRSKRTGQMGRVIDGEFVPDEEE